MPAQIPLGLPFYVCSEDLIQQKATVQMQKTREGGSRMLAILQLKAIRLLRLIKNFSFNKFHSTFKFRKVKGITDFNFKRLL